MIGRSWMSSTVCVIREIDTFIIYYLLSNHWRAYLQMHILNSQIDVNVYRGEKDAGYSYSCGVSCTVTLLNLIMLLASHLLLTFGIAAAGFWVVCMYIQCEFRQVSLVYLLDLAWKYCLGCNHCLQYWVLFIGDVFSNRYKRLICLWRSKTSLTLGVGTVYDVESRSPSVSCSLSFKMTWKSLHISGYIVICL